MQPCPEETRRRSELRCTRASRTNDEPARRESGPSRSEVCLRPWQSQALPWSPTSSWWRLSFRAHSGTLWTGCPRQGAHQDGVDGQLGSSEERQAVNHNLESARIKVVDGWRSKSRTNTFVRTQPTRLSANALLRFREEPHFCPRSQRLHKLTGGGQGCQGDGHTGKNEQSGRGASANVGRAGF